MKTFEIHITVNDNVAQFHNVCEFILGIKTIQIESLDRFSNPVDVQHMTSIIKNFTDKQTAIDFATDLSKLLNKLDFNVIRTKVESPIYDEYLYDALYVESHFESNQFIFPTSRNVKKSTLLATHREYDINAYQYFIDFHSKRNHELELCLYDSNINLDTEWFNCYGTIT